MVIVEHSQDGRRIRIQARSNFSLGRGGLLTLIATLGALTLLVAALVAWRGYWPVLAIAGMQVALVAIILVRAWKAAWAVETIILGPERIRILHQEYASSRAVEMDSPWARLSLQSPAIDWYPPRLWLKSGTRSVELGAHLNAGEKRQLAEQLRTAIGAHSAWQHVAIERETVEGR